MDTDSNNPEFLIVEEDQWSNFQPLNELVTRSDLDGDAALILPGLTQSQVEAIAQLKLEHFVGGEWIEAPFSESSWFPSMGSISAPCWYFPFDYHPGFEFIPELKGNRPEWRALIPKNWIFPS